MKNCNRLRKQKTDRTCDSPEILPAGGKGRSKKYFVYPYQEQMEAELCKLYDLPSSELIRRLEEFEFYFHCLGFYQKTALKRPITPPKPGPITPDKPQ